MPSSFSGMMHLTNSMVRHLQWAHLDAQSATRARVLQRGWGYMAIIPDPSQISASPFDSHWPMVPRAFLLVSLRWCYLCYGYVRMYFLTRGLPSFLFCFRHLWCWTKGGPFPGLVPLGPCGYSVLSTWSEEQPSKCLSTHILCTVDSSTC